MPAIALPRTRQPRLATLAQDRLGRRLPPLTVTLSVAMPAAAAAQDPP